LILYVWCDKFFNVFKGAYLQDIADIGIDLYFKQTRFLRLLNPLMTVRPSVLFGAAVFTRFASAKSLRSFCHVLPPGNALSSSGHQHCCLVA